jgi:hypothetical protein
MTIGIKFPSLDYKRYQLLVPVPPMVSTRHPAINVINFFSQYHHPYQLLVPVPSSLSTCSLCAIININTFFKVNKQE